MSHDDIKKLIGGYASGSLTDDERRQLFDAALEDQELFDALQTEQALKELLDDPFSREQIHRAASESLPKPATAWFKRPWTWAAAAAFATAAVTLIVMLRPGDRTASTQIAEFRKPALHALSAPPAPSGGPVPAPSSVEPPAASRQNIPKKTSRVLEPDVAKEMEKKADRVAKSVSAPAPPPPAPLQQTPAQEQALPQQQQAVSSRDKQVLSAQQQPATPQQEAAIRLQQPAAQQQQPGSQQAFAPLAGANSQIQQAPSAQVASQDAAQNAVAEGALLMRKTKSARADALPQVALRAPRAFTFAKRIDDGSYVTVPAGTIFHAADTIRLTVVSQAAGALVISAMDAKDRAWTRLFPPADQTIQLSVNESYTVPIDIVVKAGEVLEVKIGPSVQRLPISPQ